MNIFNTTINYCKNSQFLFKLSNSILVENNFLNCDYIIFILSFIPVYYMRFHVCKVLATREYIRGCDISYKCILQR